MTANAQHRMDPLARLGRQIVAAADHRLQRRRRRRTVLTVSAATCALGGVVGVGAIDTDIVGPTLPPAMPYFAQHGDDRVSLRLGEGLDKPWTVTVYRTVGAGLCIAAPTSVARTSRVQCGAAFITAEELESTPVTSAVGTIVQSQAGNDAVLVSGLARPDVERLSFGSATERTAIDGSTLAVPIVDGSGRDTGDVLTVRPFAVLATVPTGVTSLELIAHTSDGGESPHEIRVEAPQQATP